MDDKLVLTKKKSGRKEFRTVGIDDDAYTLVNEVSGATGQTITAIVSDMIRYSYNNMEIKEK